MTGECGVLPVHPVFLCVFRSLFCFSFCYAAFSHLGCHGLVWEWGELFELCGGKNRFSFHSLTRRLIRRLLGGWKTGPMHLLPNLQLYMMRERSHLILTVDDV